MDWFDDDDFDTLSTAVIDAAIALRVACWFARPRGPGSRLASRTTKGFDTLVDRLGVTPKIAGEVDDMAMLRLMARERGGLAVVPPIVVRDELEAGVLVEIRRLPDLHEHFYAITASRRFPNPLLRELIPTIDDEG